MPKHALLSASSSKQWLNCPPSARLCANIQDRASPYAQQGTDAHELCEYKVLSALGHAGHDPYEKKLLGITAMTSLLGKTKFNELLGGLIEKPQGKPTLVPESDKRQTLNTAIDDFNEI